MYIPMQRLSSSSLAPHCIRIEQEYIKKKQGHCYKYLTQCAEQQKEDWVPL